jgi:hypothetical protein
MYEVLEKALKETHTPSSFVGVAPISAPTRGGLNNFLRRGHRRRSLSVLFLRQYSHVQYSDMHRKIGMYSLVPSIKWRNSMKMVCSPDSTGAEINPHLYLILRALMTRKNVVL